MLWYFQGSPENVLFKEQATKQPSFHFLLLQKNIFLLICQLFSVPYVGGPVYAWYGLIQ